MMSVGNKANEVLKTYAGGLAQLRINYVNNYLLLTAGAEESFVPRKVHRLPVKKIVIIAAVLVMLFAMFIAVSSGAGLNLFKAKVTEESNHYDVELTEEIEGGSFLAIKYIPKGYECCDVERIGEVGLIVTYVNKDEEYLFIQESKDNGVYQSIDNETTTKHDGVAGDTEVQYYVDKVNNGIIALFVKNDIYFSINGHISEEEMNEIINNL